MKLIYAITILSGTIIGVGFFGLPYIAFQVGFWTILGYFLALGTLVILIHLFFGELAIKTPDFKRLPGFAKIYLGRLGEKIAYISTIFGIFGALLAYLIVGGEFFFELLSPIFGGTSLFYTIIYFMIGAFLIFFGIKAIAKIEFWGVISFFIILFIIFFRGQPFIEVQNLFPIPDWSKFFLPYGAILFSLWGAALIPEIEEILGKEKRKIKTVIFLGILVPIIIYFIFIYLVLGITGSQVTETALPGLRAILGNEIVSLALIFGILATFTSFIALGLTLKKVFQYDLKFNENLAWLITCFIPLALFLIGIKEFIPLISFIGGVMLAIDGILILLMYKKSNPKKKFIVYPLILVLLTGIVYSIIYFY